MKEFPLFSFSTLKNWFCNTAGNTAIVVGLSAVPLVGGAGMALDYARQVRTNSFLQSAADAAVLAGTRTFLENGRNETEALAVADAFFAKALAERPEVVSHNVTFRINDSGNGVNAYGGAKMETSLSKVLGINTMSLLGTPEAVVSSAETGGGGDIEVSLVLDVTGSMCNDGQGPCTSGDKLDAMKDAATELVKRIMVPGPAGTTTKVAVVPFNSHIRVAPDGQGASVMQSLTNLPATWTGYQKWCAAGYDSGAGTEGSTGWVCTDLRVELQTNTKIQPCVTDRYYQSGSGAFDYTDDEPQSDRWLNARDGTRYYVAPDSEDIAITTGVGTMADPGVNYNYEATGVCWDQPESNQILPLSTSKSDVLEKISELTGYRWTGGALGIAFGWYTLSPNWNGLLESGQNAAPYSELAETTGSGGRALRKIMVFMSDGAFNSYRGWADNSKINKISKAAGDMCEAMKDKGIEIYTVAFDLGNVPTSEGNHALTTLQGCGSSVEHFYNSLDANELSEAFSEIGNQISGAGQLRLTK